jgi:hypothetical protein
MITTINLSQRGSSKTLHGWTKNKRFHIELTYHRPKQQFMLDVESDGRRMFNPQLFETVREMLGCVNQYLASRGLDERIVLTDEEIELMEGNRPKLDPHDEYVLKIIAGE